MTGDPVTLLRAGMPPWLERRIVVVPPGGALDCAAGGWCDAIAVVEEGSVVLHDAAGRSLRLEQGAVFCLTGDVVEIRNDTADTAVVATARRRGQMSAAETAP